MCQRILLSEAIRPGSFVRSGSRNRGQSTVSRNTPEIVDLRKCTLTPVLRCQAAALQPPCLRTRSDEAGYLASRCAGRIGRGLTLPPQFGHMPWRTVCAQAVQNVHSNVQMTASVESGGRFLSQHSQLGRSCSMVSSRCVIHPTSGRWPRSRFSFESRPVPPRSSWRRGESHRSTS
jgi:hypothetical protein